MYIPPSSTVLKPITLFQNDCPSSLLGNFRLHVCIPVASGWVLEFCITLRHSITWTQSKTDDIAVQWIVTHFDNYPALSTLQVAFLARYELRE